MNDNLIPELGDELYEALRIRRPVSPLTEREPGIALDDAYRISQHMLRRRVEDDGEQVIGKKIGLTSARVQEMLGVYQPDFGFLTDAMQAANGSVINIGESMIAPRVEAEIAFRLGKDLSGERITEGDVLDATECVLPCFEIVDSRIEDWRIKIEDTIADNASCGMFVLGDSAVDPRTLDLPNIKATVSKNGRWLSEGMGNAVQGNPLTAVAWLANTLGSYGIPFRAGEIILSGSLVPLEPAVPGDEFTVAIDSIGSVAISFS